MIARERGWDGPAAAPAGRRWPSLVAVLSVAVAVVVGGGLARLDEPAPETGVLDVDEDGSSPTLGDLPEHYGRPPPVGAWRDLPGAPLEPRTAHAAVWTGAEMLVWGGLDAAGAVLADGAALDPAAGTWRPIATAPLPGDAVGPVPAVWAGRRAAADELVVWTAAVTNGRPRDVGLAYDPARDRWRRLPSAPIAARVGHTLAWTGDELFVWGGVDALTGALLGDGATLDLDSGRWRRLPPAPLSGRRDAAGLSVGEDVIVWGGARSGGWNLTDGAVYATGAGTWSALPALPAGVTLPVAAQTPPQLAGVNDVLLVNVTLADSSGERRLALLDLGTERWSLVPRPFELRHGPTAVAGEDGAILLWGGIPTARRPMIDGAVFYPAATGWRALRTGPVPRDGQTVVWSGAELLVWGGADGLALTNDGAAFDPASLSAPAGIRGARPREPTPVTPAAD